MTERTLRHVIELVFLIGADARKIQQAIARAMPELRHDAVLHGGLSRACNLFSAIWHSSIPTIEIRDGEKLTR